MSSSNQFLKWLGKVDGNKKKLAKNVSTLATLRGEKDAQHEREVEAKVEEARVRREEEQKNSPMKPRLEVKCILNSMVDAVAGAYQHVICLDGTNTETTTTASRTSFSAAELFRKPMSSSASLSNDAPTLKGNDLNVRTWEERCVAIFCYLHPRVYGNIGSFKDRCQKAAHVIGIARSTLAAWVARGNNESEKYIPTWYPMVLNMTWGNDVKPFLDAGWTAQWNLQDNANVKDQLGPYAGIANKSQTKFLSRLNTPKFSGRRRAAAAAKNSNIVNINRDTKKKKRSNSNKPMKYEVQVDFVADLVQRRWNGGDPITRPEVYTELMDREDCAEGTEFFKSYLDPNKCQSGLSNFLTRCLNRIHFGARSESIGQKVPDNWRPMAEADAKTIRTDFKAADIDIVMNADQTFVHFYSEVGKVLAPKGTKRVGGKIKANEKAGFTLMLGSELGSSQLVPPFIVFTGTKISEAVRPEQTLAYKYKDWSKGPNRTGVVTFQKKHWFDKDIFIMWLEWILEQVFPGKKVGIIIDRAPCQDCPEVDAHVKKWTEEGRLVLRYISGGLTPVLQVCDLTVNKDIKNLIKQGYYRWRSKFISAARERGATGSVTLKMPITEMADIVEAAVKGFNQDERQRRSIEKTFRKAGQDPWCHDEDLFKSHLDDLTQSSLFKANIEYRKGESLGNLEVGDGE